MTGCSDITPGIDPDCSDPVFRAAHLDICRNFTQLILKPEYVIKEPGGTVTYEVSLRANGKEVELTKGLTFDSSNLGAAVINELGVATGVRGGISTISVTWQNLSAQAQFECVASCQDTHQNFLVLIDHSKSMGQAFSSAYATKLAFSKSIGADFVDTINLSKDQIAVAQFADDWNGLQSWGTDASGARSAINSISLAQEKTNLSDALKAAVASFDGRVGVRVIVLFTDGEWTGDDPKPVAQSFRESGGFLVIVTTRAWGDFFVDMMEMASSGFLLSAYGATQATILGALSGLKSFLCSGSCYPAPGTAPMAQLNYDGFINWNVTAGRVDLIGLGLWDVRPGNGLYVDMQGTQNFPDENFGLGQLTSKADFTFTAGQNYKFSISVGGSQSASNPGTWKVRIRCGNELDQTVTISNGHTALIPMNFTWTPAGTHTGKIIIEQSQISGVENVGCTVDEIKLENLTLATTLLYDNFDQENPVVIPPSPGYSYGCTDQPPGAQAADPTPPTPRVVE